MIRFIVFWLVTIVWMAVALPILIWSALTLEVPLWPEFSPDATTEGTLVWGSAAIFFYIVPVLLFLNKKACRPPSKILVTHAQD